MIIGLILAFIQAILLPFVWLVMGDFVTFSIVREVKQTFRLHIYHLIIELKLITSLSLTYHQVKLIAIFHKFFKNFLEIPGLRMINSKLKIISGINI